MTVERLSLQELETHPMTGDPPGLDVWWRSDGTWLIEANFCWQPRPLWRRRLDLEEGKGLARGVAWGWYRRRVEIADLVERGPEGRGVFSPWTWSVWPECLAWTLMECEEVRLWCSNRQGPVPRVLQSGYERSVRDYHKAVDDLRESTVDRLTQEARARLETQWDALLRARAVDRISKTLDALGPAR